MMGHMMQSVTIPCLGYTIEADFYEGAPGHGLLLVFVG